MTDADPAAGPTWDAGDMGCGELVLELARRMRGMAPGETLLLVARDRGAPEDLPAWCRQTGHTLVAADGHRYWIRRRES